MHANILVEFRKNIPSKSTRKGEVGEEQRRGKEEKKTESIASNNISMNYKKEERNEKKTLPSFTSFLSMNNERIRTGKGKGKGKRREQAIQTCLLQRYAILLYFFLFNLKKT